MNDKKVVEIKNLIKRYGARDFQTTVLKGIDLTIYKGDRKSTRLNSSHP